MSSSNQVITLGCRLNTYESEVIQDLATQAGVANTVFINTCAVTAEAERQARQTIRKIHRNNPNAQIIVTGCSAQINPSQYQKMPEVAKVIGNEEKMQPSTYKNLQSADKVVVSDIMEVRETAAHLVSGFDGKARAFVQVQNGCDHRCTFCTIPFGRGNSRSVAIGEIVAQIRKLLENGYQEIVFTGVDITAYGADLPGQPTLGQMIRRVLSLVPELKRLRLSSLDPVEIDEDLWQIIGSEEKLMPHLHLSLQAGDNLILKRMKRRHLREDAIRFSQRAKTLRPDVVFGADLIAGFPTETDEMFENSLRIVDECSLTYLHVFPYSPRPGTPAARMPQLDGNIIKERARQLRLQGEAAITRTFGQFVGKSVNVLVEELSEGLVKGKTDHFAPIQIVGSASIASVIPVKVTDITNQHLIGQQL
ncbi:MAG: tRNA (N(6)-L-threonylcarbamoyladenosine(37)-C(2))-methylthiotransferase MtaB [Proteobacteria bacterium]|nr:tRNA (N(6)-L-threonylcarbamoyladenosine(37)-C(2))-methylthiotransferase MtaB [Pseudomonadota bacterium]